VRTLSGHVGKVQAIESNTLTILLDAGGTHIVSAIDALLEPQRPPGTQSDIE
jgi:preprotein translocase subunit YajC